MSQTVPEAARNGSKRDLLVAMRDRVATAVADPATPAAALAALTKRLMDIANDIDEIDAKAKSEADHVGEWDASDEEFDPSAL